MSVALRDSRRGARGRLARFARSGAGLALLLAAVWLRRAAIRLRPALPAIAAGLAAAIPVLVSTIHAAAIGWQPAGDDGIIATRAWDVLTSHTPLVGQFSEAGDVTGQIVHSPGPLLYWLLALPARFGGVSSLAVTMGIVNTLAIIGCVALARRRGGLALMFASAVAIALMCQSLPSESFHDIWNPAAALFPFLLLIFLSWSIACGDHRLVPLAVLDASFVTQTHLTYLAPTVGLALVAAAGLYAGVRRRGARGRPARDAAPHRRLAALRTPTARWALAALAVVAICWAPPLVDEIVHDPGNLTLVVRTSEDRGRTLGAGDGWNAVVRAVGWDPWWLYVPASEWSRKVDVRHPPSAARTVGAILVLAGLVAVAVVGLRRRRRDLASAALIALAMAAALDLNVAQTPARPLLAATVGYTAWWGSMLGMWAWLVLAWALWRFLRARLLPSLRAAPNPSPEVLRRRRLLVLGASLAGLGAVAGAGAAVAVGEAPDSHVNQYRPIATMVDALDRALPEHVTIRYALGVQNTSTQPMEPAIRFGLVRHHDLPLSLGALDRLGSHYELGSRPYRWVVYLADGGGSRPQMRRVVTVRFRTGFGHNVYSAWVARVGRGGRLEAPAA